MAPFTYITFDSNHNVSPCPALGGSLWNFPDQSLSEIWKNQEFEAFRQGMLENKKQNACHRCWGEEAVGLASERTMLWDPAKDPQGTNTTLLETSKTPSQIMTTGEWKKGPMQAAIKISNVCNLRCRSCNSADSVTLSVEGKYFEKTYGLKDNFWLKDTKSRTFTDEQIDEIADFCSNCSRIEFYGGEPLIDKQLPRLLKKLVDKGVSRNININVSTNVTNKMDDELIDTLSQFAHFNLNLSIDGWGSQFAYLRHPASWEDVYDNIRWFIRLRDSGRIPMSILSVITVTSMNVFYLPDLIARLKIHFGLDVHLILSYHPYYFSVKNIPDVIADRVADRLQNFELHDLQPVVNLLKQPHDPKLWKEFQQWTSITDQYRKESFAETFPEFYQLICKLDTDFKI